MGNKNFKYHHIGIPTKKPIQGEVYLPNYKLFHYGFEENEFGIEWMSYEDDCNGDAYFKEVKMIRYGVHFSTTLWEEFDFWRILVTNFLEDADSIRIDCWNEEQNIIIEIAHLSYDIDNATNEKMTILRFNKNEKVIEEIVDNAFNENRKLKWFSLFLERNGEIIFSSEHYGSEFSITGISKEELKWVRYVVPKSFNFHSWSM